MTTTRQQRMAQAAYTAVAQRGSTSVFKEYASFAKSFPALIHGVGLCQAVAFAQAKGKDDRGSDKPHGLVLQDLVTVLGALGVLNQQNSTAFADKVRTAEALTYLRLTRLALDATTWLKRYAEAFDTKGAPSGSPAEADAAENPS